MFPRPYFSIIICLFNCENFFHRGIKCLLSQTFKDFEIILIDDGSTDSTPQKCDKIDQSHSNIKAIHQVNQGLGAARNRGIDAARGKYLCFFDIDDIVKKEWLQNIYEEIKDIQPDLLIYGYKEINIKFKSENDFRFERKFLTDKSQLANEFTDSLSGIKFNNGFAWNKVYKKDFLDAHNLRFPDNAIQQDEIFNHRVYECFPTVLISDKILYDYYIYDKGNNRKRFIQDRIRNFENVKISFFEIKNKFEIEDIRLDEYIHRRFLTNVLFNRNPLLNFKDQKDFYSSITNNQEVIDSVCYLKKNKSSLNNIHDHLFNLYGFGIRKKSSSLLFLADSLQTLTVLISSLIRKL